jgi:hypothetical protein
VATIYDGYWIDNWIYWITHSYTQLQCIHSYSFTVYYSSCRAPLQLQLTLTTESQLLLSFFRAQDLLQTQLALTGNQLTLQPSSHLRLLTWDYWLETRTVPVTALTASWRPSYIAREQTTKKTPSPIPLLLYDVITRTDPKENTSSSDCCVALATVVNKRLHCWLLTYSVHVTIRSMYLGLVERMVVFCSWMWCPKLILCSAMADLSGYSRRMCHWCSFNLVSTEQPVCPI